MHVLGWAKYIDPTYTLPPHIKLLGEYLMKVERGEVLRLIVEMPPRFGKSEATTVKFPAFYLGRHPDRRIITASHTASLAFRFSMRARNDFDQFGPEVFGLRVNPNVGAAHRWDVLDEGLPPGQPPGGTIAAGIGGPITGQGAHLAIIDDPVKDAEAANSKVQRDSTWDWYRFVLRTRLFPEAAIVLVATRWHEDDLPGRLLKAQEEDPEADRWTVVRLPALAEEDDPLGRVVGDPLWPDQYTRRALEAVKASVGTYVWSALYQQRPQPAEGTIFKREWLRYFIEEPEFYVLRQLEGETRVRKCECWKVQTVDLAASLKESADYFVIETWGVTPKRDLLLLDVFRSRVEGPDQKGYLKLEFQRHRPAQLGIESTGYQLALMQEAIREGLPAVRLKADGDKVARSLPVAARYEAYTVYHRAGAPWLEDYETELLHFPKGEHDDQVDCAAYAALLLNQYQTAPLVLPVTLESRSKWKGR